MNYTSSIECISQGYPGVSYQIKRVSLEQRIELLRLVGDLAKRIAFAQAGGEAGDKIEVALHSLEIDKVYVAWGTLQISGLSIDGVPADVKLLLERGPEGLAREIAERIRKECSLTEDERKN